jgi:hypothetical protein
VLGPLDSHCVVCVRTAQAPCGSERASVHTRACQAEMEESRLAASERRAELRRKLDEHQRETELMQAEQQRHLDMQQQVRPFPPGPHTHTLGPYTLTHHITEPTQQASPKERRASTPRMSTREPKQCALHPRMDTWTR